MNSIVIKEESSIHSTWLTILACRKKTRLILNNKPITMQVGDILLLREHQRCSVKQPNDIAEIYVSSSFVDDLFESQISDCRILLDFLRAKHPEREHLYFRCNDCRDAYTYLKLLIEEIQRDSDRQDKMVRLLMVAFLTTLDRTRSETLIVPASTMVSTNQFGKIMKYIGDHYTTCSLKETAKQFGYNPDYLSYNFKRITGETFTEKIRSMRLKQAEHMLLTTPMTIEEIAVANGFKDKSWFMKCFKKAYGTSPAKYRKAKKEKNPQD